MKTDTTQFWGAVREARSLLSSDAARLLQFDLILEDLPSNIFEARLVPTGGAKEVEGTLVIGPGLYLESLVSALRANAHSDLPVIRAGASASA